MAIEKVGLVILVSLLFANNVSAFFSIQIKIEPEPPKDPCSSDPCPVDSTCSAYNDTSYSCECKDSTLVYPNCQDPCISNPCPQDSRCLIHNSTSYYCQCDYPNRIFPKCHEDPITNPCDSYPCPGMTDCISLNQTHYRCECPRGTSGPPDCLGGREIGCFRDQQSRDLKHEQLIDEEGVSRERCVGHCKQKGYNFASVQWQIACFCSNVFGRYGASEDCDLKCKSSDLTCGGGWANLVMTTGLSNWLSNYEGAYIPNGYLVLMVFTLEDCISYCERTPTCFAIDWDRKGACYGHALQTVCRELVKDEDKQHFTKFQCDDCPEHTLFPPSCNGGHELGCYEDQADRDMPYEQLIDPHGGMTRERCVRHCNQKGYNFAGTQYGIACFCANSFGRYGKSTECTVHCKGSLTFTCGGPYANNVFTTGLTKWVFESNNVYIPGGKHIRHAKTIEECKRSCSESFWCFAIDWDEHNRDCYAHSSQTRCNKFIKADGMQHFKKYDCGGVEIGCFADGVERDMKDVELIEMDGVTRERCALFCRDKGYNYVGIQYGIACFCSNSFGSYGENESCDTQCKDSELACGGTYTNTVMTTGINKWIVTKTDAYVPGGEINPSAKSFSDCQRLCSDMFDCFAFDFDSQDQSCYIHGISTKCNEYVAKTGMKHQSKFQCG